MALRFFYQPLQNISRIYRLI